MRLFPGRRLSQTFPSLGELEPPRLESAAEFFRFFPDRSEPTPPPSGEEVLWWTDLELDVLLPMLTTSPVLLALGWEPDSDTERILSAPFFRLIGNSLNHFAIVGDDGKQ